MLRYIGTNFIGMSAITLAHHPQERRKPRREEEKIEYYSEKLSFFGKRSGNSLSKNPFPNPPITPLHHQSTHTHLLRALIGISEIANQFENPNSDARLVPGREHLFAKARSQHFPERKCGFIATWVTLGIEVGRGRAWTWKCLL